MGHKTRLKKTDKINEKEELNYFEQLIGVLTTIRAYERKVDEVEQFEDERIVIDLVTFPKCNNLRMNVSRYMLENPL